MGPSTTLSIRPSRPWNAAMLGLLRSDLHSSYMTDVNRGVRDNRGEWTPVVMPASLLAQKQPEIPTFRTHRTITITVSHQKVGLAIFIPICHSQPSTVSNCKARPLEF